MVSSSALLPYHRKTYFMLSIDPTCRIILSTVYFHLCLSVGARAAMSLFGFLSLALVFLLTLRRLGLVNPSVLEIVICKACVLRSVETVLCTRYSSMTRKSELTTIMQNRPRQRSRNAILAAVAILSAMRDLVPDKGSLSTETRPSGRKIGALRTRWF